ncbi:hypothetical protein NQ317_013161 [Molorchus minor]|uniref:Uncharacterized protein n=1 Tax=Molorchus minor TaxID=1323400 RepID=A0ABQ9JYK5_9CUCU|nr:hypothetical protein NQ317_013161 [Molorchus minor]
MSFIFPRDKAVGERRKLKRQKTYSDNILQKGRALSIHSYTPKACLGTRRSELWPGSNYLEDLLGDVPLATVGPFEGCGCNMMVLLTMPFRSVGFIFIVSPFHRKIAGRETGNWKQSILSSQVSPATNTWHGRLELYDTDHAPPVICNKFHSNTKQSPWFSKFYWEAYKPDRKND